MKVLLREDVKGIGRRGDVVEVTGGYARNYLLPSGKAMTATDSMAGQAESMRRSRDVRDAKDREAAQAQAKLLAGAVIGIQARAAAGGRLFGSVGPVEIVKAIHVLAMPPEKPARRIGFRPDAASKPKMLMANTVQAAKMRRGL